MPYHPLDDEDRLRQELLPARQPWEQYVPNPLSPPAPVGPEAGFEGEPLADVAPATATPDQPSVLRSIAPDMVPQSGGSAVPAVADLNAGAREYTQDNADDLIGQMLERTKVPHMRPDPWGRANQAMYAAFTRQALPKEFFTAPDQARQLQGKLGMDADQNRKDLIRHLLTVRAGSGQKYDPVKDKNSPENVAFRQGLKASRPDIHALMEKNAPGSFDNLTQAQFKDIVTPTDRLAGRDAVWGRSNREQFQEFQKETQKLAGAVSALKEVDKAAPGLLYGFVPKNANLGNWDVEAAKRDLPGGIGRAYTEPEKERLYGALDNMKMVIMNMRSGKAVSDAEAARYDKLLVTARAAGPWAIAAVLPMFRRELGQLLTHAQQSYYLDEGDGVSNKGTRPMVEAALKDTPGMAWYKDKFFEDQERPPESELEQPKSPAERVKAVGERAKTAADEIVPVAKELGSTAADVGKEIIKGAAGGLWEGAKELVGGVTGAVSGALNKPKKSPPPGPKLDDARKQAILNQAPPPPSKTFSKKAFLKALNVTVQYKDGKAVGVEPGDTRGQ